MAETVLAQAHMANDHSTHDGLLDLNEMGGKPSGATSEVNTAIPFTGMCYWIDETVQKQGGLRKFGKMKSLCSPRPLWLILLD
jgi:hypothetical protein